MKLGTYLSVAVTAVVLGGCAQQQIQEKIATPQPPAKGHAHVSAEKRKAGLPHPDILHDAPTGNGGNSHTGEDGEDIWTVIGDQLAFADKVPDQKITRQLEWLDGHQTSFGRSLDRASLYLPYVLDKVIEADMPAEVALLPFVESAYNPFASSPNGAAGLWQFIPATGDHFGLHSNRWFEGRRDIVASTDAALDYLGRLNQQFDGDWLLTLAAYNAGPGTLRRAIEKNEQKGLPTDFWSLDLPDVTKRYVPRLVAVSKALVEPENYGINRPFIAASSDLEIVEFDKPIDLAQAAKAIGLDARDVYNLNPGYTSWITPPAGPYRLMLPAEVAGEFQAKLAGLSEKTWQANRHHVVSTGDTLGGIARKEGTSADEIARLNNLRRDGILRIGQVLKLPPAAVTVSTPSTESSYEVQRGDSLYAIAKRFKVDVNQLLAWNDLSSKTLIKPGQQLKIFPVNY